MKELWKGRTNPPSLLKETEHICQLALCLGKNIFTGESCGDYRLEPFIFKFSTAGTDSKPLSMQQVRYDPNIEVAVTGRGSQSKLAIEDSRLNNSTGSLLTEASNDPTRDEPTDR
jgi:hypothetical protein